MTEDEFKTKLTPEEYRVMREKGTESPGSGALLHESRDGTYMCKACGAALFPSTAKFDSGTGWPSFDQALPDTVKLQNDNSFGEVRTEVVCARCGSHLGHVFSDGPTKTGERYCMNSVCLEFKNDKPS
jgi:peptide-methionine (R)-S-oxide reductase